MQELDDHTLLREYLEQDSQEAFATLVTRHVSKVYSVAWRRTGNMESAEEITQAVFVILAKKAHRLLRHTSLSGWLYETARLASVTYVRSEIRRARREQEVHMQTLVNEKEPDIWRQIAPLLDAALGDLSKVDRHAVVLRFFDGKSMKEIGTDLGTTEDAAKMRVSRALERLRYYLSKRGVDSTTAILAGTISANAVQAAPAGLAKAVTAAAFSKGAALSISTSTLIKGALKVMVWTKVKTAVVVGTLVLFAGGATFVAAKGGTARKTGAAAQSDVAALQGTWSGQESGASAGSAYVVIQGTNLEFHAASPQEWYKGTFSLREDISPKQLVGVVTECPAPQYVGKTSYAIYQLQDGKFTLVGNEPGNPRAPEGFDAQGGRKFEFTKKQ